MQQDEQGQERKHQERVERPRAVVIVGPVESGLLWGGRVHRGDRGGGRERFKNEANEQMLRQRQERPRNTSTGYIFKEVYPRQNDP